MRHIRILVLFAALPLAFLVIAALASQAGAQVCRPLPGWPCYQTPTPSPTATATATPSPTVIPTPTPTVVPAWPKQFAPKALMPYYGTACGVTIRGWPAPGDIEAVCAGLAELAEGYGYLQAIQFAPADPAAAGVYMDSPYACGQAYPPDRSFILRLRGPTWLPYSCDFYYWNDANKGAVARHEYAHVYDIHEGLRRWGRRADGAVLPLHWWNGCQVYPWDQVSYGGRWGPQCITAPAGYQNVWWNPYWNETCAERMAYFKRWNCPVFGP